MLILLLRMRIENWDAERKRDSAQPQELRIGQIPGFSNLTNSQFSILIRREILIKTPSLQAADYLEQNRSVCRLEERSAFPLESLDILR
jgi:hypothetical protein